MSWGTAGVSRCVPWSALSAPHVAASWALPSQMLPTLLVVTQHTRARTWGRGYGTGPYMKGAVPEFYEHQGTINASNLLLFEHPNYKPVSFCYLLSNGCAELFIKHMQNLSPMLHGSG